MKLGQSQLLLVRARPGRHLLETVHIRWLTMIDQGKDNMETTIKVTVVTLLLAAFSASAATLYVSQASPKPTPPYTNWDTAAMTIQDAVDAATSGATVMVADGVYPGGVTVANPLTLVSVNGPQFTAIDGAWAFQCVSLTDGDSLTGFTLRNGYVPDGAGGGVLCESTNAFVTNCVMVGNSAAYGGGAYGCTLYACTLTNNSAFLDQFGDGGVGGGACGSTLCDCTLTGNSASGGGGACASILYGCTLTGNWALPDKYGNYGEGGGAYGCELCNCTLTGNSAETCGGACSSALYNSIVYFNTAPYDANYDSSSALDYCYTTPLPTDGVGNVALDPLLAGASRLSAASPCRGAGSVAYATGTDIDGEPWANPPSIGCDEYHAGAVTGPITVGVEVNYTIAAVGYPVSLTALIDGRPTASVWDFGDGVVVSNRPYASHAWAVAGDYEVVLLAYNDTTPGGVSATETVHVIEDVHYVDASSADPQWPYTTWDTAAVNIQDAVDAAVLPGALVLVTNGVYVGGVTVTNPLTLRSASGPQSTVIDGGVNNTCCQLSGGAALSGFTLTNGTDGVSCDASGVVSNCVITGDTYAGAAGGTLYNCALTGNSGEGAYNSTLYNCTLTGNAGIGASGALLYNCIVYYNGSSSAANYDAYSTLNYCCATPLETNGVGNIDLDPQLASATHLSAISPCRGAGSAAYATGTDIDGEPWANPPAIGCDEYRVGAVTGPLTVSLQASYAYVPVGYSVTFTALIDGRTTLSVLDFGDGVVASNQPYASHAWTTPGDYAVVLRAYNESYPGGVSATGMVRVAVQPVLYVAADSANPVAPYISWATAATNIQDAVAAAVAGEVVLVTNGVYSGGVDVESPLAIVSVNGPQFTIVSGGGAGCCVYLNEGASLTGFTVTNGGWSGVVKCSSTNAFLTNCVIVGNGTWATATDYGGGASGGTLYNCTLAGNSAHYGGGAGGSTLFNCTLTGNSAYDGGGAYNSTLYNCVLISNQVLGHWVYEPPRPGHPGGSVYYPGEGGGACGSTLYNCTLTANSAADYGGGAYGGSLYNCTLTGNSGKGGGGAYGGTLYNCTLTANSAPGSGGGAWGGTLYNCTLTANSAAYYGGGAYGGTFYNCIVYFNSATNGANYRTNSILNYCCTTPLPTNGVGNITNEPLFVNTNGWSNLHLQTNSPGINSGDNSYVATTTDLDGNPRIAGGTVDMGAYEFQPCISGGQFGCAACSPLAGFSFTFSGAIVGQPYRIQTSTTLAAGSWTDLTNFTYTGPTTFTDPSAVVGSKKFYRAVSP